MKNTGKIFESEFMSSMPSWAWCYRLRDSAGTWQGGMNTRFTPSNICDFMVMANRTLNLFELKTHKGKSLPLSCIKMKNLEGMIKAEENNGIASWFLINFRDLEETYALKATDIANYVHLFPEKKSIDRNYVATQGKVIPHAKKKVYYVYDLKGIL